MIILLSREHGSEADAAKDGGARWRPRRASRSSGRSLGPARVHGLAWKGGLREATPPPEHKARWMRPLRSRENAVPTGNPRLRAISLTCFALPAEDERLPEVDDRRDMRRRLRGAEEL